MMPSDSGSRRAASGGALERKNTATASNSRTAATIRSVLRVRLCIRQGADDPSETTLTPQTPRIDPRCAAGVVTYPEELLSYRLHPIPSLEARSRNRRADRRHIIDVRCLHHADSRR